jgi:hypothetical protein
MHWTLGTLRYNILEKSYNVPVLWSRPALHHPLHLLSLGTAHDGNTLMGMLTFSAPSSCFFSCGAVQLTTGKGLSRAYIIVAHSVSYNEGTCFFQPFGARTAPSCSAVISAIIVSFGCTSESKSDGESKFTCPRSRIWVNRSCLVLNTGWRR